MSLLLKCLCGKCAQWTGRRLQVKAHTPSLNKLLLLCELLNCIDPAVFLHQGVDYLWSNWRLKQVERIYYRAHNPEGAFQRLSGVKTAPALSSLGWLRCTKWSNPVITQNASTKLLTKLQSPAGTSMQKSFSVYLGSEPPVMSIRAANWTCQTHVIQSIFELIQCIMYGWRNS